MKKKHRGYGDTFFIDEIFVNFNAKQHYLWRAVDQDGEVVDVYLQARRDGASAKRFFKRLIRGALICRNLKTLLETGDVMAVS